MPCLVHQTSYFLFKGFAVKNGRDCVVGLYPNGVKAFYRIRKDGYVILDESTGHVLHSLNVNIYYRAAIVRGYLVGLQRNIYCSFKLPHLDKHYEKD